MDVNIRIVSTAAFRERAKRMKRQQDLKGQKEVKGMGKNYKRQQDPEKERSEEILKEIAAHETHRPIYNMRVTVV